MGNSKVITFLTYAWTTFELVAELAPVDRRELDRQSRSKDSRLDHSLSEDDQEERHAAHSSTPPLLRFDAAKRDGWRWASTYREMHRRDHRRLWIRVVVVAAWRQPAVVAQLTSILKFCSSLHWPL